MNNIMKRYSFLLDVNSIKKILILFTFSIFIMVKPVSAGSVNCKILPETSADREKYNFGETQWLEECSIWPTPTFSGCECAERWCTYWCQNDICDWNSGIKISKAVCNVEYLMPHCMGSATCPETEGLCKGKIIGTLPETTELPSEGLTDKELYTILLEADIKFYEQDLIDYAGAENIHLLVEYYSPVDFGLEEKTNIVKDLSLFSENAQTIDKIKNVVHSINGRFGTAFKVIPYVSVTIPRNKIKDFKTTLSSQLGTKIGKIYVSHIYRTLLTDSIPLVNADKTWNLNDKLGRKITGKNIKIAIIDTGIDYTHPDLGGCLGSGCKVIGGFDYYNYDNDPKDENGHGTHVAAIAAGNGVLKGVAPDAKLLAYRNCGKTDAITGGSECYFIEDAISAAVNAGADIVSMSIGWPLPKNNDLPYLDPICLLIYYYSTEYNVDFVISAGNEGAGNDFYNAITLPGACKEAITVGAIYKKDPNTGIIAPFSSRGPVVWNEGSLDKPDLVAPGVLVCSARTSIFEPWNINPKWNKCVDNNHVLLSGTSMAAPFVSGVVALLKQSYPDLTPSQIKSILKNSAVNLGYDKYTQGAGLVDALHAIEVDPSCYS